jgi:hypothetical protein
MGFRFFAVSVLVGWLVYSGYHVALGVDLGRGSRCDQLMLQAASRTDLGAMLVLMGKSSVSPAPRSRVQ